jgi:hypothetical protein
MKIKKIIAGLLTFILAVLGIGIGYIGYKSSRTDVSEKEKSVTVLQADYPEYNTAEELVESADLVFTGIVKNIEYQMLDVSTDEDTGFADDEKTPYTLYMIDVDKVYKAFL